MPATAAMMETKSIGATPYKTEVKILDEAATSGIPIPTPAAPGASPPRRIIHRTWLRSAPSAMRTPSSLVRRATLYEIVPYRPVATRIIASTLHLGQGAKFFHQAAIECDGCIVRRSSALVTLKIAVFA